jgi:nucleoside-diphosphate-sugar epimerase
MQWVILGCGYVGTRLARALLKEGVAVRACALHPEKLEALVPLGAEVLRVDALKRRAFGPPMFGTRSPVVVYSIPPLSGAPPGEAVVRAAEAATAVGAERFIYLSSTAVYGETEDGQVVDEESPIAIADPDGGPRIAEESAVQNARLTGLSTVLLRLAAIYGPGRGVRERLRAGTYRLLDGGTHVFSRVHVDDVVGVIRCAAERAPAGALYCVADDRPTTQREYVDWLTARLSTAAPEDVATIAPGAPRRRVRNRAVSNARLKRELSYVFRYPSYIEGEPAIEAEAGIANENANVNANANANANENVNANANANANANPAASPALLAAADVEARWWAALKAELDGGDPGRARALVGLILEQRRALGFAGVKTPPAVRERVRERFPELDPLL